MTISSKPHPLRVWISQLPQWLVVAVALPLVVLDGWVILLVLNYFQSIISAFLLATVLSFLLNYPVKFLQQRGIERTYAVLIIFLLSLTVITALAVTLVPLIVTQIEYLVKLLPQLVDSGSRQLQAFQGWAAMRRLPVNVNGLTERLESMAPEGIESFSLQLPSVVLGAAEDLLEVILVVALTLYLLLHGKTFWQGIFRWLPRSLSIEIQQSIRQNFQNYFVGQATVALIQGTVLSLTFLILRLPLFLLFGIGIGLLALIPFFDVLGVLSVSLIASLTNVWLGVTVFVVCIVIDQIIDNAVSPRVMGKLVGLNPVWIILSLLLGAQVLGFIGIILAIPLASTIRDILNHLYPEKTDEQSSQLIEAPAVVAELSPVNSRNEA